MNKLLLTLLDVGAGTGVGVPASGAACDAPVKFEITPPDTNGLLVGLFLVAR